jgi:hypothetical protein
VIYYLLFLSPVLLPPIEFASLAACEKARTEISAIYDRRTVCVAKGEK